MPLSLRNLSPAYARRQAAIAYAAGRVARRTAFISDAQRREKEAVKQAIKRDTKRRVQNLFRN